MSYHGLSMNFNICYEEQWLRNRLFFTECFHWDPMRDNKAIIINMGTHDKTTWFWKNSAMKNKKNKLESLTHSRQTFWINNSTVLGESPQCSLALLNWYAFPVLSCFWFSHKDTILAIVIYSVTQTNATVALNKAHVYIWQSLMINPTLGLAYWRKVQSKTGETCGAASSHYKSIV